MLKNVPKKIYLQIGEHADIVLGKEEFDFNELCINGITWSKGRISENDIEYMLEDCTQTRGFWERLEMFVSDIETSDFSGWEEKEMILHCCKERLGKE